MAPPAPRLMLSLLVPFLLLSATHAQSGLTLTTCRVATDCGTGRDCYKPNLQSPSPCQRTDLVCFCAPRNPETCAASTDCERGEQCSTVAAGALTRTICVACNSAVPNVVVDDPGDNCLPEPVVTPSTDVVVDEEVSMPDESPEMDGSADVSTSPVMDAPSGDESVAPTVTPIVVQTPMASDAPEDTSGRGLGSAVGSTEPSAEPSTPVSKTPRAPTRRPGRGTPEPDVPAVESPMVSDDASVDAVTAPSPATQVEPTVTAVPPSPPSVPDAPEPTVSEAPVPDVPAIEPTVTATPATPPVSGDGPVATASPGVGSGVDAPPTGDESAPVDSDGDGNDDAPTTGLGTGVEDDDDDTLVSQSDEPVDTGDATDTDVVPPPGEEDTPTEPNNFPETGSTPEPSPEPICIHAKHLAHLPASALVYDAHRTGIVLCDGNGSCATAGHIVEFDGVPMMMKTYCASLGARGCAARTALVNSPRIGLRDDDGKTAVRIPSGTDGLLFTAHAARFESRLEEAVLTRLIRYGL